MLRIVMELKLAVIIAVLLALTACEGSGYNRSYIISDSAPAESTSDSEDALHTQDHSKLGY